VSQIPVHKWFSKRGIGALNLLRGRGKQFQEAKFKLAALDDFRHQQEVDLVICTGDYTALGLEQELVTARMAVSPLMQAPSGYITVPGNHDLYLQDTINHRWFEQNFKTVLQSDLPEYCVDGIWPQVRLIGDNLAVIGVNSARANPLPWRSNGIIPSIQLNELDKLLDDARITQRFVIVITHYAARMPDGKPDSKLHGLINADEFLAVCRKIKQGALLCGHIHHRYEVDIDGLKARFFCAGSCTMQGRESFWLYQLDDMKLTAYPGHWDGQKYTLDKNP